MIKEQITNKLLEFNLPKFLDETTNLFGRFENSSDFNLFSGILNNFPQIQTNHFIPFANTVEIGNREEIEDSENRIIIQNLKKLSPWRKGPFSIFGNFIDSEWQSWMKWERVEKNIKPLKGKSILDIGCGNGYYSLRMLAQNPRLIIGLEPFLLNLFQFYAVSSFLEKTNIAVLPSTFEEIPQDLRYFDIVFSMGVLYHRRSPFKHLHQLKQAAKSGGQAILETLVIDGKNGEVLVPQDRYAKMRNVWFIPSILTLESWLKKMNFTEIQLVDVSVTTTSEQRKTEWMQFESLEDFLSEDKTKTLEGLPLPKRATFVMEVP